MKEPMDVYVAESVAQNARIPQAIINSRHSGRRAVRADPEWRDYGAGTLQLGIPGSRYARPE